MEQEESEESDAMNQSDLQRLAYLKEQEENDSDA